MSCVVCIALICDVYFDFCRVHFSSFFLHCFHQPSHHHCLLGFFSFVRSFDLVASCTHFFVCLRCLLRSNVWWILSCKSQKFDHSSSIYGAKRICKQTNCISQCAYWISCFTFTWAHLHIPMWSHTEYCPDRWSVEAIKTQALAQLAYMVQATDRKVVLFNKKT